MFKLIMKNFDSGNSDFEHHCAMLKDAVRKMKNVVSIASVGHVFSGHLMGQVLC